MLFSFLTFAASWLLWAAAVRVIGGDFAHPSRFVVLGNTLYLLGVFAPAFVALSLTAVRDGSDAVRSLLRRATTWDVNARFYVFAILFYPLARVAAAMAQRAALGAWPESSSDPLGLMLVATLLSTPVQAGEELGWRGFLLPRLSPRLGLPAASIVVGLIWAAWHLPFFFVAGTDKSEQPFLPYAAGVTALSVAMAWLYWQTNGSLFLTMLMHAAVNNIRPFATPLPATGHTFGVNAPFVSWATVAVMWTAAAGLLISMRRARDAPGSVASSRQP